MVYFEVVMSALRHLIRLQRPFLAARLQAISLRKGHDHGPIVSKATSRMPPIGPAAGEQSDPEIYNDNPPWPGEQEHWMDYRDNLGQPGAWDDWFSVWLSAVVWGYVAYMFYWHSDIFFVQEFYQPDPFVEFTDAELGIPSDSEPDPEYWGDQQPR